MIMYLVIFCGLQASGKSTFFETQFHKEDWVYISKDQMPRKNKQKRQMDELYHALRQGSNVIVDNTNPTVEDRAAIIELGREYKARMVCYYFRSDIDDCWERNLKRGGKACVPKVALLSCAKKMQRPRLEEGFSTVFDVRLLTNGYEIESAESA